MDPPNSDTVTTDDDKNLFVNPVAFEVKIQAKYDTITKELLLNLDNDIFLEYCKQLIFIDTLVFFNISGLCAFCNKSDCEGYYSVGNSYDICQLFKLIKNFYIVDKEFFQDIHKTINKIKKVFQESVRKRKIITIS